MTTLRQPLARPIPLPVVVGGPGCANCLRLELVAEEAVQRAGVEAEIRKVTDYRQILAYGVMSTPALVIDSSMASAGRIPSVDEVIGWLTKVAAA